MKPIELFVHFDEGDPAGIVFFGNFYRLAHRALELSFPQWGLTWEDFFKHPGVGFPVRHSEADYLRPIRPGQKVYVTVTPEKIGESSVTFKTDFRESEDLSSPIHATTRVTHVAIDTKTLKKTPLPKSLKEKLS